MIFDSSFNDRGAQRGIGWRTSGDVFDTATLLAQASRHELVMRPHYAPPFAERPR